MFGFVFSGGSKVHAVPLEGSSGSFFSCCPNRGSRPLYNNSTPFDHASKRNPPRTSYVHGARLILATRPVEDVELPSESKRSPTMKAKPTAKLAAPAVPTSSAPAARSTLSAPEDPAARHCQHRHRHDAPGPALYPGAVCCSSGGGGGAKLGVVRVGLGLLAMGDLARACGAASLPAASPAAMPASSTAPLCRDGQSESDIRRHASRRRVGRRTSGGGGGGGGGVPKVAFVVASSDGGRGIAESGDRRRMTAMRRRSRVAVSSVSPRSSSSSSASSPSAASPTSFALPTSPTMLSSPADDDDDDQQQPQQQQPRASPREMNAAPPPIVVGVAVASTSSAGAAGANGAVAAARSAAGAGKGTVASATAAAKPRTVKGVSSVVAVGETKRLGVIRPAELGDSRAKRAKVKAMYARARKILRYSSPSAARSAAGILEEALALDPKDGHSWLLLARTWEGMGNVAAATEVFEKAVVECPENVHLWQSWGMLQDKFGDPAMARVSFANGLKADPGNPFVCHAWGLMEQRDGDNERAREILESSRPRMATSKALAELLAKKGNIEEARVVLQAALDRLEAAAAKRSNGGGSGLPLPGTLACSFPRRSTTSAALLVDLEIGLDHNFPPPSLATQRNFIDSTRGDEKRAQELVELSTASEPDNAKARIGRARFEMRRGNMRDARVTLSDAANLPQEDGSLFSLWATLETREGNYGTALKIAEAATARFPGDKFLLQTMGTVHGKLGQYEAAIDCYRRSIAVGPAAPAYVAWALVVAKLAGRAQKDLSRNQAEEALYDEPFVEVDTTTTTTTGATPPGDSSNGNGNIIGSNDDSAGAAAAGRGPTSVVVAESSSGDASTSSGSSSSSSSVADGRDGERITGNPTPGGPSYEEARRLFELGMLADPAHGPLYNAYGTMEAKIGNVEHARDVYRRGIAARCTGAANVWQGFGKLEASAGNRDAAREIFARGIRESTEDVSFLCHSLGSLELAAERLDQARAVFVAGLERYPSCTQLLLGAALAITRMGEPDDARDYFRRAVEADPSHAHAWQAWGLMETRSGNFDVARSLWERGLKANPMHGPLWQAYAVMEEKVGETERARKLFAAGLERCPDHVHLHQAWAVMEGMLGQLDRARELVLDGLRVDAYHGALWTVYAIIERQAGSDTKARKVLKLGVRASPDHGPLYRAWAQMEHQLGNTAEARRRFEQGLEACPAYTRLYYAYADMEAAMGNTEFLEKLKSRGEAALTQSGASADQVEDFQHQMEAFESFARFDANTSSEQMESTLDRSSLGEFDFDW
ncbi:unnamed protein product [Scytosiphon promiscuus]